MNNKTKIQYGLIGERLGHSFSKKIHEKLADYCYELCPLSREEFPDFMKQKAFRAINVTIPYKCEVIPYLSDLDETAKAVGAVNTIVNENGVLVGYNTDFNGFLYTLEHNHIETAQKKVLVLGKGGASKAIIAVLNKLGAREIVTVYRTTTDTTVCAADAYQLHSDAQIIVNTTPVGMYPNVEESPIDLSHFSNCSTVIDIIYNPLQTKLLKQGTSLGMKTVNGLEMLIAQAKYAVEIFLDTKIDNIKIEEIYIEMTEKK